MYVVACIVCLVQCVLRYQDAQGARLDTHKAHRKGGVLVVVLLASSRAMLCCACAAGVSCVPVPLRSVKPELYKSGALALDRGGCTGTSACFDKCCACCVMMCCRCTWRPSAT